jgi:hypothetical protein
MEVTTPRKDQHNSAARNAHRTTVAAGLWDTLGVRGFKAHFRADNPVDSWVHTPRPRRKNTVAEGEAPDDDDDDDVKDESPWALVDDVGKMREVIVLFCTMSGESEAYGCPKPQSSGPLCVVLLKKNPKFPYFFGSTACSKESCE